MESVLNFALDMEYVARPYRQHPAQVIDAKPHEWVRSEGPDFNREAHRNGRRVPTGCRKPLEHCFLSRGFIQVERLRIKFGRKPLNVFLSDRNFAASETQPEP